MIELWPHKFKTVSYFWHENSKSTETKFFTKLSFWTKIDIIEQYDYLVDDRKWNFEFRPKPKLSAKSAEIRPKLSAESFQVKAS